MIEIIQSAGTIFLIVTTLVTANAFRKNSFNGFQYFMFFLILSGFIGFARPILFEEVLLPVFLFFSLFSQSIKNPSKINKFGLLLFVLCLIITSIGTYSNFDGPDNIYFFGFVLISFSNYLFSKESNFVYAISLIWLYSLARVLWLLMHSGSGLFNLYDISNDDNRILLVESGLSGSASEVNVDPNYLGFITGIGAILSYLFYVYHNEISKHFSLKRIKTKSFLYLVMFIGFIELSLTIMTLSRGMILALLGSIVAYFFVERKFKKILVFVFIAAPSFIVFSAFFNLILNRFNQDDNGGGRYEIWNYIFINTLKEGNMLFGFGLNYPWWKGWSGNSIDYFGTHNSWVSIFLALGLIGFILLFTVIFKSIYYNFYKDKSILARIRLVMLAFIIISYSSIEPLLTTFGWILLALVISFKIENKRVNY